MKSSRRRRAILLAALLGTSCSASYAHAADREIVLDDSVDIVGIGASLDFFEDPAGKLTIDEVSADAFQGRFLPRGGAVLDFGNTSSAYWFRFTVTTSDGRDRYLVLDNFWLSHVDLYVRISVGGFDHLRSGMRYPLNEKEYKGKSVAFPLRFQPGRSAMFFLRVEARDFLLRFAPSLQVNQVFLRADRNESVLFGMIAGMMIAMALYQLIVFMGTRETPYLVFSAFILSALLMRVVNSGFGPEYLWPEHPQLTLPAERLTILLWVLASIQFARTYLESRRIIPRIDLVLIAIAALEFIVIVPGSIVDPRLAIQLINLTGVVLVPILGLAALVCFLKGHRPAAFYILASVLQAIFGTIWSLDNAGIIKVSFGVDTSYLADAGTIATVAILSFGIASKMRRLGREREKARQEAFDSLKKADRIKDEFLANTSHELRTPLHGIIGIAESLYEGAAGEQPAATRRDLGLIVSSGRRLASLVNDILDFAKLKQGDIGIGKRAVDIRRLCEVVLNLSLPLVKGRPVELRNRIPESFPAVLGDEDRIQQILHNLVGNAVKFTHRGEVVVAAGIRDGMAEISVTDSGIGIRPDRLADIFKSFEQADASITREYGGTGLGLSITKTLVELHGGEIRVSSEPGNGSCFTFTLPLAADAAREVPPAILARPVPAAEPPGPLPQTPRPDSTGPTILVVDDEPVNRQVLLNQLSPEGFRVVEAASGEEALRISAAGPRPDLVLLDLMMPRMSGYEVCRKLRDAWQASELPVIMLTAKNQVSDLVEGFGVGANDYIAKPCSRSELLARVRTHLGLAKINLAYGRFVPREFMSILRKESILDVRLGDHVQQHMTIMFADIRSFTSLSEGMSPQETFDFINEYLGEVVPVIRGKGGFVDKYIGDGIMALFPARADDAVDAAIAMQERVRSFNENRARGGHAPIAIGIGLHAGSLILGAIGEPNRMDETVISDAVNLASRVEGLTKIYGASILASEETFSSLEAPARFHCRSLGRVGVKGKSRSVSVLEVTDGDARDLFALKMDAREEFEKGLALYYARDFAEASVCFNNVAKRNPRDRPALIYRERSAAFLIQPPGAGWDGADTLEG